MSEKFQEHSRTRLQIHVIHPPSSPRVKLLLFIYSISSRLQGAAHDRPMACCCHALRVAQHHADWQHLPLMMGTMAQELRGDRRVVKSVQEEDYLCGL